MENSCDLLIMNASVVIPKVGIMNDTNIMIEDGKIKSLEKSTNTISATKKVDARGKYVLPGAIDPHVHYGVYTPIDYSIHASILRPDQVNDIPYLREVGITSLKIYMNLGGELNRIHMDLAPGTYGAREGLVDMTDELMSSIVNLGASMHSTILVHAE